MNSRLLLQHIGYALAFFVFSANVQAATTDLAATPLMPAPTVLPNLMFILDDSGSMGWSHMPDAASAFDGDYGYASSQCNGVYYNPQTTYDLPVTSTGTTYPAPSFTGAWNNGYNTGAGTTNLSTSFQPSGSYNRQAAFYYKYTGAHTSDNAQTKSRLQNYYDTGSTFYRECNSNVGSAPGNGVFTQVVVSATSGPGGTDERQNFANWYSYYRTRMNMMKSSAGIAFQPIGGNVRVAFMTINNNAGSSLLNFAAFDATQKDKWYSKLYGATPDGSTPLRRALSDAGRIYANKLTSLYGVAVTDPIQYSCQKNFTLLSTDGFWNESAGYQLDGSSAIGNQDGAESRPYYDGSTTANTNTNNQNQTRRNRRPGRTVTGGGTSDTLADVAHYYYATDLRTHQLNNCTSGSTGNTLCVPGDTQADKKSYNNVQSTNDKDTASWQHMSTYTLGLGVRGNMVYGDSNYWSDRSGDFYSVKEGTTANPAANPPICSWQTSGACNWPVPASNSKNNIDDLWHAAVNGRGTYYSATDPDTLSASLAKALDSIMGKGYSLTAPSLSNTTLSDGNNFMFVSNFSTAGWYSELVRQQIDPDTGEVITDGSANPRAIDDWNAQARLDIHSSRTIYTFDATNAQLKAFTYANLTDAEKTYFNTPNITAPTLPGLTGLTQFLCASPTTCMDADKKTAAAGNALVEYLRGDRSNEGALNDNNKYYRQRDHVLGDIANSEAVFVKAPKFKYADAGYGAFKAAQKARQPMVYVGANDGMLHAFYAYGGDGSADADPVQYMDTVTGQVVNAADAGITQVMGGDEAWAYIPSMLMPKLFTLADKNYANKHQFFVDGTPVIGDICVSKCTSNADAVWKTILVGGLSGGGKGYYALDITNPAKPKALWEFNTTNAAPYGDANLGYSYGKPVLVKLNDADKNVANTWAVLVTSGYNNTHADGTGRLYVLNAVTGAIIRTISTSCPTAPCSANNPSGLAQITAMAASSGNRENTVLQVYGGDLRGNVWRFDVNNRVGAAGYDAQLLATLAIGNTLQPITTKPELGLVDGNVMVYVGTGKYLGNNNGVSPYGDAGNTDQQTMYAIRDPLLTTSAPATPIYKNLRASSTPQTVTVTTCPTESVKAGICASGEEVRTGTHAAVDLATKAGWYIDLPAGTGERVNTDPRLSSGTLVFNSNTPQTTACSNGASYIYQVDYRTGAPIIPIGALSNAVIGKKIGDVGASRAVVYQLESGKSFTTYEKGDGSTPVKPDELLKTPPGAKAVKRSSWRELINDR